MYLAAIRKLSLQGKFSFKLNLHGMKRPGQRAVGIHSVPCLPAKGHLLLTFLKIFILQPNFHTQIITICVVQFKTIMESKCKLFPPSCCFSSFCLFCFVLSGGSISKFTIPFLSTVAFYKKRQGERRGEKKDTQQRVRCI